jgi:hypothetical protein
MVQQEIQLQLPVAHYGIAYDKDAVDSFLYSDPVTELDAFLRVSRLVSIHAGERTELTLLSQEPLRQVLQQKAPEVRSYLKRIALKKLKRSFNLFSPLLAPVQQEIEATGNFYGQMGVCECGEEGCGALYGWIQDDVCLFMVETRAVPIQFIWLFPFQCDIPRR